MKCLMLYSFMLCISNTFYSQVLFPCESASILENNLQYGFKKNDTKESECSIEQHIECNSTEGAIPRGYCNNNNDTYLRKPIYDADDYGKIIKFVMLNNAGELVLGMLSVTWTSHDAVEKTLAVIQDADISQFAECSHAIEQLIHERDESSQYPTERHAISWQEFTSQYPELSQAMTFEARWQLDSVINPRVLLCPESNDLLERYLNTGSCKECDSKHNSLINNEKVTPKIITKGVIFTPNVLFVHKQAWPLLQERLRKSLQAYYADQIKNITMESAVCTIAIQDAKQNLQFFFDHMTKRFNNMIELCESLSHRTEHDTFLDESLQHVEQDTQNALDRLEKDYRRDLQALEE